MLIHHSHYSFLRATPTVPRLVTAAKEKGYEHLLLADIDNLHGVIEFVSTCKKNKIHPLIGVTVHTPSSVAGVRAQLILIAKNIKGYKELLKIVTILRIESKDVDAPSISPEKIAEISDNIWCVIPQTSGVLSIAFPNKEKIEILLKQYKNLFGDSLCIGISKAKHTNTKECTFFVELAGKNTVPLVPTHAVYYINKGDDKIRDILLKIQPSRTDPREFDTYDDADLSMPTQEEYMKLYSDIPEAFNTLEKIKNSTVTLESPGWIFPLPVGVDDPNKELHTRIEKGFYRRGIDPTDPIVKERVKMEIDTIVNRGYSPYFLVVGDIIGCARELNIQSATRGSAAGSLVSYLLGITNIDPIEYELPFERFLNPFRPSAPDIDFDVEGERRGEIIKKIRALYGEDKVAQIGTFGTMLARAIVRDVTRALGYSYGTGDQIARLIPLGSQTKKTTLKAALETTPELRKLMDGDKYVKEIIEYSKLLEGNARHASVHAGGIVISPTPLSDHTPLQRDSREHDKLVTQYDMHAIEKVGLLKIDLLGLHNLSIISKTLEIIEEDTKERIDIDNIPVDDQKVFDTFSEGKTTGLFQVGSRGVTGYIKQLQPKRIHDINAMLALYRPGPIANIPIYIRRKNKREPVIYLHPKMRSYLEKSYGILVYQEDVMFTALHLAGYNWKTVDTFRKAIGKKITAEMDKQHSIFIEGCKKHSNLSTSEAEKIWDLFKPFEGYGFNKAHAASYGFVTYKTAYLKTYYPEYFFASLMTIHAGDVKRIAEYINDAKEYNIPILPPNIHESVQQFSVLKKDDKKYIRFGLSSIKNFGTAVADIIIQEREKNGPFQSLSDFLKRMPPSVIHKRSLEALVYSGALDSLGRRGTLLKNIETMVLYNREANTSISTNTLFGNETMNTVVLKEGMDITDETMLYWEKELLGVYVSGHPILQFRNRIKNIPDTIKTAMEKTDGYPITLIATISEISVGRTKRGKRMATLIIEDEKGIMEANCFPEIFARYEDVLGPHRSLILSGKISIREEFFSLVIEKISEIPESNSK